MRVISFQGCFPGGGIPQTLAVEASWKRHAASRGVDSVRQCDSRPPFGRRFPPRGHANAAGGEFRLAHSVTRLAFGVAMLTLPCGSAALRPSAPSRLSGGARKINDLADGHRLDQKIKPAFKTANFLARPLRLDDRWPIPNVARYTHRVAISNDRLVGLDDGKVQFRWKDYRDNSRHKTMTLAPQPGLGMTRRQAAGLVEESPIGSPQLAAFFPTCRASCLEPKFRRRG